MTQQGLVHEPLLLFPRLIKSSHYERGTNHRHCSAYKWLRLRQCVVCVHAGPGPDPPRCRSLSERLYHTKEPLINWQVINMDVSARRVEQISPQWGDCYCMESIGSRTQGINKQEWFDQCRENIKLNLSIYLGGKKALCLCLVCVCVWKWTETENVSVNLPSSQPGVHQISTWGGLLCVVLAHCNPPGGE